MQTLRTTEAINNFFSAHNITYPDFTNWLVHLSDDSVVGAKNMAMRGYSPDVKFIKSCGWDDAAIQDGYLWILGGNKQFYFMESTKIWTFNVRKLFYALNPNTAQTITARMMLDILSVVPAVE